MLIFQNFEAQRQLQMPREKNREAAKIEAQIAVIINANQEARQPQMSPQQMREAARIKEKEAEAAQALVNSAMGGGEQS